MNRKASSSYGPFFAPSPARSAGSRVGALAAAEGDFGELPGVAVGPAPVAPGRYDPIPRDDEEDRVVLFPAGIADEQSGATRGEAGLDPLVTPTTQLARHLIVLRHTPARP